MASDERYINLEHLNKFSRTIATDFSYYKDEIIIIIKKHVMIR